MAQACTNECAAAGNSSIWTLAVERGRLECVRGLRHFTDNQRKANIRLQKPSRNSTRRPSSKESSPLLFSQPQPTLRLTAPRAHAQSIGLDIICLNAEMAERNYTQRVQEHRQAGGQLGLHTTPAFLLNGVLMDVSFGFERLDAGVRAALKS